MAQMTFGIQPQTIARIESEASRLDENDLPNDPPPKGWALYEAWFWDRMGKEAGWDPFTLCLHYFAKKARESNPSTPA